MGSGAWFAFVGRRGCKGQWPAEGILTASSWRFPEIHDQQKAQADLRVKFSVRAADFLHLRTGFSYLRLGKKAGEKLTLVLMIDFCLSLLSQLAYFGKMSFINKFDHFLLLN